jgi:hypothetical protein
MISVKPNYLDIGGLKHPRGLRAGRQLIRLPFLLALTLIWSSEIDTLEGVNLQTNNRMGLHTLPGCTITGAKQAASSKTLSTDCSHEANNNQGCIVTDGDTASYGEGFGKTGGGMFITEFAETGIS